MKTFLCVFVLLIISMQLAALSCYDIQYTSDPSGDSPYANQVVTVEGIVVAEKIFTGINPLNYGFMIADPGGGPWSGLFIFTNAYFPARGDLVQVTGTISEYFGFTEMATFTEFLVLSSSNLLPQPSIITTNQLANDAIAEQWESVFVAMQDLTVTSLPTPYGEFFVNNSTASCQVDDQCFPRTGFTWPDLSVGQNIHRIKGIVDFSFASYGINPRDLADLQFVPFTCDLSMTGVLVPFWQELNVPFSVEGFVQNNTDTQSNSFEIVIDCNGEELARLAYQGLGAGQNLDWNHSLTIASPGYKNLGVTVEIWGDEVPANNHFNRVFIVKPDPGAGINFGAGDLLGRVPWDFYWRYSLYETIYYPEEICPNGLIEGISFFNDFESNLIQLPLKLWIGETNSADLSSSCIPASELNLAFYSYIAFPIGANEIYIPFATPYQYQGGNLVIMAYQTHNWYYAGFDKFQVQNLNGARSRKRFSDAYDPDPNNPPGGIDPTGEVPRICFYMVPGSAAEDLVQPAISSLDCRPNPFHGSVVFKSSTTMPGSTLGIYNLRGQKLISLPWEHDEISWNGLDEKGHRLPAGIYLARLTDGKKVITRKICKLGR